MYVCIWNAITTDEIRAAGTFGARSLEDLKSMLGVASWCGRCADCALAVLAEGGERAREAPTFPSSAA